MFQENDKKQAGLLFDKIREALLPKKATEMKEGIAVVLRDAVFLKRRCVRA